MKGDGRVGYRDTNSRDGIKESKISAKIPLAKTFHLSKERSINNEHTRMTRKRLPFQLCGVRHPMFAPKLLGL